MFKGNEEQIIKELVNDILHLEDRIEEITVNKSNEPNQKQKKEIETIQQDYRKNTLILTSIQTNNIAKIEESNQSIRRKQADITTIEKSISDIEDQIRQMAISSVTSTQSSTSTMNYERISDIINAKKTNDDLTLLEKEYAMNNSNHLSVKASLEAKYNKRNEFSENMIMMREEKKSIQHELINLISQKESFEEIAKNRLNTIKKKDKSINTNSNISVFNSNNPNPSHPIELYRYEISLVDLNRIGKEISEALIESNDDIVFRIHLNNLIKNEVIDYLRNYNWSNKTDDLMTIISVKGFNILQTVTGTRDLTADNLKIYIKTQFKVFYYEKIIANKLSFISKEYKTTKKQLKSYISRINEEISKLNVKKEEIEGKIKENKYKMNILIDNKAKNGLGLTKKEKALIQLNDKLNELNELKENTLYQINHLTNNTNDFEYELNKKRKEINAINTALNKRMNAIEEEIKSNYIKANEDIVHLRHMIADKFRLIKTQLKIYKEQYGDKVDLYNKLVEEINDSLKISTNIKSTSSLLTLNDDDKHSSNNKKEYNHYNQVLYSYKSNNNYIRLNQANYNRNRNRNKSYVSPAQHPILISPHEVKHNYQNSYCNLPLSITESIKQSKDQIHNTNNNNNNTNHIKVNTQNDPFRAKTINKRIKTAHPSVSPTRNKQKSIYSINTNNTSALWDDERMKLEQTIQKLKSSISNKECIIDKDSIINKIKPIVKTTFCYFRFLEKKGRRIQNKYNPLEHSINDKEMGFMKANICINTKLLSLDIKEYAYGNVKEIPIDSIDSTVVTNTMKDIIKIFRNYHKSQMKSMNIEDFVKKEEFKDIPLNSNERIKAAVNQLFNMTIKLNINQRIEFVFITYDDFKLWLNGIAFLLKNKFNLLKFKALLGI